MKLFKLDYKLDAVLYRGNNTPYNLAWSDCKILARQFRHTAVFRKLNLSPEQPFYNYTIVCLLLFKFLSLMRLQIILNEALTFKFIR